MSDAMPTHDSSQKFTCTHPWQAAARHINLPVAPAAWRMWYPDGVWSDSSSWKVVGSTHRLREVHPQVQPAVRRARRRHHRVTCPNSSSMHGWAVSTSLPAMPSQNFNHAMNHPSPATHISPSLLCTLITYLRASSNRFSAASLPCGTICMRGPLSYLASGARGRCEWRPATRAAWG